MQLATQYGLLPAEPGSLVPHVGQSGCDGLLPMGVRGCLVLQNKNTTDGLNGGSFQTGQMWAGSQSTSDGVFWVVVLHLPVKNTGLLNPIKANLARGTGGMSSQWEF